MDASQMWFRNFSFYFDNLVDDVVDYYFDETCEELVIKLRDGRVIAYDEYSNKIRYLPRGNEPPTEEVYKKEFCRRLRRRMYVKNITQTELSKRTGIGQDLSSRYISGKANPTLHNVYKIARALGCSIDELSCK